MSCLTTAWRMKITAFKVHVLLCWILLFSASLLFSDQQALDDRSDSWMFPGSVYGTQCLRMTSFSSTSTHGSSLVFCYFCLCPDATWKPPWSLRTSLASTVSLSGVRLLINWSTMWLVLQCAVKGSRSGRPKSSANRVPRIEGGRGTFAITCEQQVLVELLVPSITFFFRHR